MTINRFPNPAAFARAADAAIPSDSAYRDSSHAAWTKSSVPEAIKDCTRGRIDRVGAAQALLGSILFNVPAPRSEWRPSVVGAYPCVPAALSGFPESMRRRVKLSHDAAPIALYLDLVSSAGVDAKALEKRGVAFLALAMALCNVRPVSMYAVIPMSSYGNGASGPHVIDVIQIPTTPLDLASACGMLTNAAACRLLGYGHIAGALGDRGNWYRGNFPESPSKADGYAGYGRDTYSKALRADLGLNDGDFYMPGVGLGDPMTEDPIGFITRAVREAAALEST